MHMFCAYSFSMPVLQLVSVLFCFKMLSIIEKGVWKLPQKSGVPGILTTLSSLSDKY